MKKLLLSAGALMLSLGYVYSQGATSTGAHDDFATNTEYTNIAWDEGSFTMTRAGDFTLDFVGTSLGGNTSGVSPSFRVDFATALDLSAGADVEIDVENVSSNIMVMKVELIDGAGTSASIEPNVSDVTSGLAWGTTVGGKYPRKADNGLVLNANARGTFRIDFSSVSGAIGGLTRTGWMTGACTENGPYCGPVTEYQIDPSDIVAVVFTVNFDDGRYIFSMGVGDGDHTDDYIIDNLTTVVAFTGTVTLHSFKVGSTVAGVKETSMIDGSLKVYPNPAKEMLNISFESAAGAKVSLTDIVGTSVYDVTSVAGENKMAVNTEELPAGLYMLNISTGNGNVSRKVMIK